MLLGTDIIKVDWVDGDIFGLRLPASAVELRQGGPEWLTQAFRAAGSLTPDERVTAIRHSDDFSGGATGSKMLLSVEYDSPRDLPTELFVKFSRNFSNHISDNARHHMASEVRLGVLSTDPAFPIATPRCFYADFHGESGTGLLITERIPFGTGTIEPLRTKCMDHILPNATEHYRVLISALGQLAGAHKAGRIGPAVERFFPLDVAKLSAGMYNLYDQRRLDNRVNRLAEFVSDYPRLFPAEVANPAFLARFRQEAPRIIAFQERFAAELHADPAMIALCHWNANIDNAWFWRKADGSLYCGLIDWGSVGQMSLVVPLWGCLSGCEPEMWSSLFPELMERFVAEFEAAGGGKVDLDRLNRHFDIYVAMMGLSWLIDSPPRIKQEIPDPSVLSGPTDPLLDQFESARTQLKMTANVLTLWQLRDFGRNLRDPVAPALAEDQ